MRSTAIQRQEQAERLREARTAAGFSTATAAVERFGFKLSSYMANENGQNGLTVDNATRYAEKFGVDASWLLMGVGKGPKQKGSEPPPAPPVLPPGAVPVELPSRHDMPRDVPVYGVGACGDETSSFEINTGDVIDYVRRPARLAGMRDAYALYTAGTSMRPWRDDGRIVFVAPRQPVRIQDHVVVVLKPERPADPQKALIKRLLRRTEKELRLEQYTPAKEITVPMRQVQEIHRIMDWDDLYGF